MTPLPCPLPGVPGRGSKAVRATAGAALCGAARPSTPAGEFPYNPAVRRKRTGGMAKKDRNDLLDRLVYLALRVVNMAVHSWGIGVASELAKFVGAVMFAIDKRHRDRAMGNLRRSFPDAPERQLRRLARRSMQALCLLGIEVLFTTRLIRIDTFRKYIVFGPRCWPFCE